MTRSRLNRPVLAVSLLLPVLSAVADDTPPLFRFAPQWLENHPVRTQAPATESAPVRKEEARPLAAGRGRVTAHGALSDGGRARTQQCEAEIRQRDHMIRRLSDLQAGGQNIPRPAVPQPKDPDTEGLRAALKASQDANDALAGREKQAAVVQAEASRQAAQSARELAVARAEGLRLSVENKALMLRADAAQAQLTTLQDIRGENQRLRDALAGRAKQAAAAQTEASRQAAQSARELAAAQEQGLRLGLESKALTLRADIREAQLAALQDIKRENQRLRDALSAAGRPGDGIPVRPAASAPAVDSPDAGALRADRTGIKTPSGSSGRQLTGDYAAGVAFGQEALSAVSMNMMLGVQTRPQDLASGFTDALLHTIRYPEKALENTLALRRLEVQAARDRVIKTQHAAGAKALAAFRREPGVRQDAQGYWYRIDTPGTARLSADSTLSVSVRESLAGADATEKASTVRQKLSGFPPLFRSVIEKLGLHGSVTFLAPPALAWGDDGFPPRIPPGATMIYRLTVTGEESLRQGAADRPASEAEQRYLDVFIRKPGVKQSPRGFWYQIIEAGDSTRIHEDNRVTTVMRESLAGGRVINDMIADKQAVTLPLSGYPPLFREAILLLNNHGAIRLVVPARLAYGHSNMPDGVRPDSVMEYDIRIVGVEKDAPVQKKAKPKAASPPVRTGSG